MPLPAVGLVGLQDPAGRRNPERREHRRVRARRTGHEVPEDSLALLDIAPDVAARLVQ